MASRRSSDGWRAAGVGIAFAAGAFLVAWSAAGSDQAQTRSNTQRRARSGAVITREHFEQMDTDDDGKLSLEEMQAAGHFKGDRGPDAFKALDKDGDGFLSPEEAVRRVTQAAGRRVGLQTKEGFQAADKDGDGFVTLDEARAAGQFQSEEGKTAFDLRDKDHDGRLSLKEVESAAVRTAGQRVGGIGLDFSKLDTNHDGFVTLEEARAGGSLQGDQGEAKFKEMDTDGDGRLSMTEAKQAH